MHRRGGFTGRALSVVALAALAAGPVHGAGFSIFEQGAKALGMGGAFTAQADDPSMLFYNAGGLAFVEKAGVSVGATWIRSTKADFKGANPFPGDGYSAQAEDPLRVPAARLLGGADLQHLEVRPRHRDPVRPHHRVEEPRPVRRPLPLHQGVAAGLRPQPDARLADHPELRHRRRRHRRAYSKVELNRDIAAIDPFTQMADRHRPPEARLGLRQGQLRLQRRHPAQVQRELLLGPLLPQQDLGGLQGERPADPDPDRRPAASTPSSPRSSPTTPSCR